MRRIGVLMPESEDNPESRARVAAFQARIKELGWTPGRNLQIDYRWGMGNVEKARAAAADLLKLTPDLVLAVASPAAGAMQQTSRAIQSCSWPSANRLLRGSLRASPIPATT
jgi:putative ABC transport system substrate-binding protein